MTDVAALTGAYAAGATTPTEVAEAFVAASPDGAPWHAFRSVRADDVLAQAAASTARWQAGAPAGPLDGVLVGVKDFVAVAGHRSHAGTRDLVAHGDVDAVLVARLREVGAVIAGKTRCTELGIAPTGVNAATVTPVNPHAPAALTGGSSSGTGAAVAAGLVTLGVGSDGGGSIRIPSACCGLFGLKPSWDAVPTEGEMSVGWWSVEHIGPMGRTTADIATMFSIMADQPADLDERPLRYGVDWAWWGQPDPEVDAACRAVAAELDPVDVALAHVDLAPIAGYVTAVSEVTAGVWDVWAEQPERFTEMTRAVLGNHELISGVDYVRAQQVRTLLDRAFADAFTHADVLVVPTTATAAPPRPDEAELVDGVVDLDAYDAMTAYTFPANLCGLPAASVPVGTTADGRPIGLQLVGRRGDDAAVLSACAALERVGLAAAPTPPTFHDPLPFSVADQEE